MIRVNVVNTVDRDPASWRILQATDTENGERVLDPSRRLKAAVRQQAVVPNRYPLPEDMDPNHHRDEANPGKKIRDERQETKQVDNQNGPEVKLVNGKRLNGLGDGHCHLAHSPLH